MLNTLFGELTPKWCCKMVVSLGTIRKLITNKNKSKPTTNHRHASWNLFFNMIGKCFFQISELFTPLSRLQPAIVEQESWNMSLFFEILWVFFCPNELKILLGLDEWMHLYLKYTNNFQGFKKGGKKRTSIHWLCRNVLEFLNLKAFYLHFQVPSTPEWRPFWKLISL